MTNDPLVHALQKCSFHPRLMMVQKALIKAGYGDVEILDRRDAGQKSRYGGHELSCVLATGPVPLKVNVKVLTEDVRIRTFDELAGCLIRTGADAGLVITTGKITRSGAKWQAKFEGKSRMDAMDGRALADLIRRSGFATRQNGEPDYAFFTELEKVSEKVRAFGKEAK